MEKEKLILGKPLEFSGYPIEIFYKKESDDYLIKCKGVYISYRLFLLWKLKSKRKNEIGFNEKGKSCKIRELNNTIRISCLTTDSISFNKLNKSIKTEIKCHKKQQKALA